MHSESASAVPESPETGNPPSLKVAVVIPIVNEAATLRATLESIVRQSYPRDLIEVLIVDGGSTDDWRPCLESLQSAGVVHRVLRNPRRSTAAGVNIAVEATDADTVLWISGHCVLSEDYLSRTTEVLAAHENVVVGGHVRIAGKGVVGRLNALVQHSRFGTGMASWRFHKHEDWVEAVTFALFPRQRLRALGGLDERLARNQDNDLIDRLRRTGTRFRLLDCHADYLVPGRLRGLWRRAWGNGSWNIWCWRLGRPVVSWYHLAPMAAVAVGIVLLVFSPWSGAARMTAAGLGLLYAVLAAVFSISVAVRDRCLWAIPILPVLFLVYHTIYGLGSLTALVRPVPPAG